MRRVLCRLRPAMTVQPVEPVVGMAPQVLTGQCECIEPQNVEVGGGGIPVREMVRADHDESSCRTAGTSPRADRSEEHTSELQSPCNLVCRLLLEKKKKIHKRTRVLTTLLIA